MLIMLVLCHAVLWCGVQAGSMDVIINHLPGTPDGVARAPDGNFWTALLVSPPKATQVNGTQQKIMPGACNRLGAEHRQGRQLFCCCVCCSIEVPHTLSGAVCIVEWVVDCCSNVSQSSRVSCIVFYPADVPPAHHPCQVPYVQ